MAKNLAKKVSWLILASLFLLAGSGMGRAAALTGDTVVKAVQAAQSKSPSPEEKKALTRVTEDLSTAILKKLEVNPSTASQDDVDETKSVGLLTLKLLDVMTCNDRAGLASITLDEMVDLSLRIVTKGKELRVTDKDLSDEKYLRETLFPAVINDLVKTK